MRLRSLPLRSSFRVLCCCVCSVCRPSRAMPRRGARAHPPPGPAKQERRTAERSSGPRRHDRGGGHGYSPILMHGGLFAARVREQRWEVAKGGGRAEQSGSGSDSPRQKRVRGKDQERAQGGRCGSVRRFCSFLSVCACVGAFRGCVCRLARRRRRRRPRTARAAPAAAAAKQSRAAAGSAQPQTRDAANRKGKNKQTNIQRESTQAGDKGDQGGLVQGAGAAIDGGASSSESLPVRSAPHLIPLPTTRRVRPAVSHTYRSNLSFFLPSCPLSR